MKQRVEEMEKEAAKLREMQEAAEKASESGVSGGAPMDTEEDKTAADNRSIYVGNVRGIPAGAVCGELTGSAGRL